MTTYTVETPIRVSATHYQITSSNLATIYNLVFIEKFQRWVCDCPDARPPLKENDYKGNGNPNCKHRRRLLEFIKTVEAQQKKEIALNAQAIIDNLAKPQVEDRLTNAENFIAEMSASFDDFKRDMFEELNVARNRFMQDEEQLRLLQARLLEIQAIVIQQSKMIEIQDQEIELLKSQPVTISAEQIILTGNIRQERKANGETFTELKPGEIQEIRNEQGRIVQLKCGRFTMQVQGRGCGNCNCSHGLVERFCSHVRKGNEHLETAELKC